LTEQGPIQPGRVVDALIVGWTRRFLLTNAESRHAARKSLGTLDEVTDGEARARAIAETRAKFIARGCRPRPHAMKRRQIP
jgi:hypothetical protein